MKKFILAVLIIMFCVVSPMSAKAETDLVCGESYMFVFQDVVYLLKFISSNPELPCSSGTVNLYWLNQKLTSSFTVYNIHFVNIAGIGKFVLDTFAEPDKLYFLTSTDIVFDLY